MQGNSPPRAIADAVVPASPLWKGMPQPAGGVGKRATVSGGSDQSSDGGGSRTYTPGVHAATHVRRGRRRPPPDPASVAAGLGDVAVSETGPADIFAEPASVAERRANRAALDTLITERLRVELRRGGGGSGSDSEGSDGGGRALLESANGTTSDANAFVAGPLSAGGTYTRRAPRAIPVAKLPALARIALSAGSSGLGGLSADAPAVALGSIGSGAARLAKPGVYPLVVGIDPPLSLPASMQQQRRRPSLDGPLPSPGSSGAAGGGHKPAPAAASSTSSSPMVHLVQSSAQVRRSCGGRAKEGDAIPPAPLPLADHGGTRWGPRGKADHLAGVARGVRGDAARAGAAAYGYAGRRQCAGRGAAAGGAAKGQSRARLGRRRLFSRGRRWRRGWRQWQQRLPVRGRRRRDAPALCARLLRGAGAAR